MGIILERIETIKQNMTDNKQILNSWKDIFDLKDNSDKLSWMHQYAYETDSPKQVVFFNLNSYNNHELSKEELIMPLIRELNFYEYK